MNKRQIKSSLTWQEENIAKEGERQYLKGKGTNWRKVKTPDIVGEIQKSKLSAEGGSAYGGKSSS